MRAWLPIARLSRPAIAVVALYAFVLGTFLGSFAPGPLAAAGHILCSPEHGDGSAPSLPTSGHRDCCTPACPGGASLLPTPSASSVLSDRRAYAFAWARTVAPEPDTAALRDTRARGPPLA
jgi:hypothetical protein